MADWAHVPGHGSKHLFPMHALFDGQSVLTVHSGLQSSYGFPKYSGKQVQDPAPFCSRQIAFAPQGDGMQGLEISSIGSAAIKYILYLFIRINYIRYEFIV